VRQAPERPAVVVLAHHDTDPGVLREVCAGAEEEGVPTRVAVPDRDAGDVTDLAHTAARDSRLGVGVGLDAAGGVAVHHALLPARRPVVLADAGPAQWRRAGRTAARIVKRTPLD